MYHYSPYELKIMHEQHVKDIQSMMQPWHLPQMPQFLRKIWKWFRYMSRVENSQNHTFTIQSRSTGATQEVVAVNK